MALSTSDAKYLERALKDFFGLNAKRINVSDDAPEGEKAEREYILRLTVIEQNGSEDATKRTVWIESVADAIKLTSAE